MPAWDGPFTAGKCMVVSDDDYDGAAVFGNDGQPFAFVTDDVCVGGRPGAIARATRIAESLNRDKRLLERSQPTYASLQIEELAERIARGLKLLDDIDSGAVELWSEGSKMENIDV